MTPTTRSISLLGASGYSGAELLWLLLRHPGIRIHHAFANASAGRRLDELYPRFRGRSALVFEPYTIDSVADDDLVVLALPSGEAMKYVPDLLAAGKRVLDLGGDFRLHDPALYSKYYKHDHLASGLLNGATYGLPEWNRERIRPAQLVANPGCYVTSALLPLIPLLRDGLINPEDIIVSSQSGVSGAGRSASVDLSFVEVDESVKAYKIGVHQHTPEIETFLAEFSGCSRSPVVFVPHLIPIVRGIYSSMYAVPANGLDEERITECMSTAYGNEPFVRLLGNGVPEIKHVQRTNYCDIGWTFDHRANRLVILSAIDNLVKGAAGQALQNINLMLGFNETEGLL